jgi:hypothetical protein
MTVILTRTSSGTTRFFPTTARWPGAVVDDQQRVGEPPVGHGPPFRLIAWSASVALVVASFIFGVDLWLALRIGILSEGLPYDGIGYAFGGEGDATKFTLQWS